MPCARITSTCRLLRPCQETSLRGGSIRRVARRRIVWAHRRPRRALRHVRGRSLMRLRSVDAVGGWRYMRLLGGRDGVGLVGPPRDARDDGKRFGARLGGTLGG